LRKLRVDFVNWTAGYLPRKQRKGSGVPHDARGRMKGWVHVTVRIAKGLPSLRREREFAVILERFHLVKERFGCKLRQFSVLGNHMHFLVETERASDLSRYMQGLQIRLAKALNKLWSRRGSVFSDRFHARLCDTRDKIRAATRYVLNNARRHGIRLPAGQPDPFSSAPYYCHWTAGLFAAFREAVWPIVPGSNLDWHHYPVLDINEVPGWTFRR